MNKFVSLVAASACAASLFAQEAEAPAAEETETSSPLTFGVDLDFFSAYVWRNAVQNDQMVLQPGVWADFTALEPFTFGAFVWQNYDLTHNRRRGALKHALTETDYNVHAGVTAWESEDEAFGLDFEIGHDWYTYQGVRSEDKSGNPDTRELYLKATFSNPLVDVYGQASWMYDNFGDYRKGVSYELGLTREQEVGDTLTLGADWNVNFGDGRYLYFLYGGSSSGTYLDEDGEPTDDYDTKESGFGGTTVKLYAIYQVTEWMSLKGTIAYTGLLNGNLRDACDEQGADYDFYGEKYPRDLLWGGLSLNIAF